MRELAAEGVIGEPAADYYAFMGSIFDIDPVGAARVSAGSALLAAAWLAASSIAAHSGGPRAGAMVGGAIGSLKGEEDIAHHCRLGDEGDDAHVASSRGAGVRCVDRRQKRPTTFPNSSMSMRSEDGTFGSPGIVMMSPQTITTNWAPAASRTSRTLIT